tara:strand:- start:1969 stop:2823 length:855 start_codon:yes stop_codon:yes gene_type:complete
MTTATGDYAIDWSGVGDINPYTSADFAAEGGGAFKIQTGMLRPAASSGRRFFAYTGEAVSGDIYVAKVEVGHSDATAAGDFTGPAILDVSGNGYGIEANGATTRLRRVTAWVGSSIDGVTDTTYSVGDVFKITVNAATGAIEGFKNDVSYTSATDATHSTGFRPGVFSNWGNTNAAGAVSFAADNVGAALSLTAPDTVTHGVATTATGDLLSTVNVTTGMTLEYGTVAIAQTAVLNVDALDFTPDVGVPTLYGSGNAVASLPLTPDSASAGTTAYQVTLEITDG